MNRTVRRALGVAACTLALSATTAAAHADTQTHRDPRGDVATLPAARAQSTVDIVRSVNRYEGDTLRLAVTTANLAEAGYGAQWAVRADGGEYIAGYDATQEMPQVYFFETSWPGGGRGVLCQGVTGKANEAKDTVVVTVPAACLGDSDTVRIGATMTRPGAQRTRIDDARRDGFPEGAMHGKYGPVLARG